MTVAALRERVAVEAHAGLMPVLLERAALHHRKGWRDCDCTWCKIKQRATFNLGMGMPRIPDRVLRKYARENMRKRVRIELAEAFAA